MSSRGRTGGNSRARAATADAETTQLQSEAKALKRQGGSVPFARIDSQLALQRDSTDPQETLQHTGSPTALYNMLIHEPDGSLQAMIRHDNLPSGAKITRGADKLELARAIAVQMARPEDRAALNKQLLQSEIQTRTAAVAAKPPRANTTSNRTAAYHEARIAKLRDQLAKAEAAYAAYKANPPTAKASGTAGTRAKSGGKGGAKAGGGGKSGKMTYAEWKAQFESLRDLVRHGQPTFQQHAQFDNMLGAHRNFMARYRKEQGLGY